MYTFHIPSNNYFRGPEIINFKRQNEDHFNWIKSCLLCLKRIINIRETLMPTGRTY